MSIIETERKLRNKVLNQMKEFDTLLKKEQEIRSDLLYDLDELSEIHRSLHKENAPEDTELMPRDRHKIRAAYKEIKNCISSMERIEIPRFNSNDDSIPNIKKAIRKTS